MREYTIDGTAVSSFDDFIAAVNVGFLWKLGDGGGWNGNLDAFNDYLFWPDEKPYRLVIRGWDRCAAALERTRAPLGGTMLDEILEIFSENPQAQVELI